MGLGSEIHAVVLMRRESFRDTRLAPSVRESTEHPLPGFVHLEERARSLSPQLRLDEGAPTRWRGLVRRRCVARPEGVI